MGKLRIGLSANMFAPDLGRAAYPPKTILYGEEELYHWVADGGALPIMIPRLDNSSLDMRDFLEDIDAVIMSGGVDIAPQSYGEEPLKPEWSGDPIRDAYEIALFRLAYEMKKPILGICRGHQLINVALGGTLYQDTKTQRPEVEVHRDGVIYDGLHHNLVIKEGAKLSEIYKGELKHKINTVHHQAIKDVAPGLRVEATSESDNVIEAVFLENADSFVLGVQWHPEWIKDHEMMDASLLRDYFFGIV